MALLNSNLVIKQKRPVRFLQFGTSPLIRGLIDWDLQIINEETSFQGGIALVTDTNSTFGNKLVKQDGRYTVLLNDGDQQVEKIVSVFDRFLDPDDNYAEFVHYSENAYLKFIVSDLGDEGWKIDPQDTDLKKNPQTNLSRLLAFLYHRYENFQGDLSSGFYFLPSEQVNNNGQIIKDNLLAAAKLSINEPKFEEWLVKANHFYDTYAKRNLTEATKVEIKSLQVKRGYTDKLLLLGEYENEWLIKGDESLKEYLPYEDTRRPLNIQLVKELPAREVKDPNLFDQEEGTDETN